MCRTWRAPPPLLLHLHLLLLLTAAAAGTGATPRPRLQGRLLSSTAAPAGSHDHSQHLQDAKKFDAVGFVNSLYAEPDLDVLRAPSQVGPGGRGGGRG